MTPTTAPAAMDSLQGQILIAMPPPAMGDKRFERSVIYICVHASSGAMGLVINKSADNLSFDDLATQLKIEAGDKAWPKIRVHLGGPVETSRGFVLHSTDYLAEQTTLEVSEEIGLTATVDILKDIAKGQGPARSLLALGYAGWGPGQLEQEIKANGWLHAPADPALIFDTPLKDKWERALASLGVSPSLLSNVQGTA